jgi:hypothetical protein
MKIIIFNQNLIIVNRSINDRFQSKCNHKSIILCYNTIVFSHTPIITNNQNDRYQHKMKIIIEKIIIFKQKLIIVHQSINDCFKSKRNNKIKILCYDPMVFSHTPIITNNQNDHYHYKMKIIIEKMIFFTRSINDRFESKRNHKSIILCYNTMVFSYIPIMTKKNNNYNQDKINI